MKRLKDYTVVIFEGLPVTGLGKGREYKTESFIFCETDWFVTWFPSGSEEASPGHCSVFLNWRNAEVQKARFSLTLTKNGETVAFKCTYIYSEYSSWGWNDFIILDELIGGTIVLRVEIASGGFQWPNINEAIIGNIERDIKITLGETSIWANSAVLRCHSPVFQAMLDGQNGFVESDEKCIKLEEDSEKYITEFFDFLHAGNLEELDITQETHLGKFEALITLADKYQVYPLLEYLLLLITDTPCKNDIFNRLKVLSILKRIPMCNEAGKLLMRWVKYNVDRAKLLEFIDEFLFLEE